MKATTSQDRESDLDTIKTIYHAIKDQIENQILNFRDIGEKGTDVDILIELVFCLLTPQSNARTCWNAVKILIEEDLVLRGCSDDIKKAISIVRFKNKKSEYIIEARNLFTHNGKITIKDTLNRINTVQQKREWLAKKIKGFGYKEASHFLRNIGLGDGIAILDRHLLKNLKQLGVINAIPKNLPNTRYVDIEAKMLELSGKIEIPVHHLDFVLWYRQTGYIFK
jgi:N-glycosylase/DNA lyase